nr:hypothetical protein [Tanacetum cinerariifolium]
MSDLIQIISQSGLLDNEWVREVLGLSPNVGLEALAKSLNIPEGSQDKDSLKVLTELLRSQSMKVLALLVCSLVIVVMKNEGALLYFHDMGKDHGMRKRKKRCKGKSWALLLSIYKWSRQRAPLEQKAASCKHYSKSNELRNKSEASRGSLFRFSAASYREGSVPPLDRAPPAPNVELELLLPWNPRSHISISPSK